MPPRAKTPRNKATPPDASMRIVVLHGKEPYFLRERLRELRDAIERDRGEPEVYEFDGKAAPLADVFDELRSYSLMQRPKVVVVDDADAFVKTHRAAMERYAAAPADHATLVLRAATWNRGNLDKLIAKVGAIVECKPMGAADASNWLVERAVSAHGRPIRKDAATAMVERLGVELDRLDSELAKLALLGDSAKPIDRLAVEQAVGRGSDEQAWAVQEAVLAALGRRQPGRAIEAVHELVGVAGQPDVLVMYFVADLMRKLWLAEAMARAGVPQGEVARRLKLWGPRAQAFFRVAQGLGPGRAAGMLAEALRYDARSKSGFGKPMGNLECFLASLADVAR